MLSNFTNTFFLASQHTSDFALILFDSRLEVLSRSNLIHFQVGLLQVRIQSIHENVSVACNGELMFASNLEFLSSLFVVVKCTDVLPIIFGLKNYKWQIIFLFAFMEFLRFHVLIDQVLTINILLQLFS